jgi:2-iminobutanoate/2-iminopropanoate deaminase
MVKKFINGHDSPDLPFSAAVKAGKYIFTSGQVGVQDPETAEQFMGIGAQCRQCLENMKKVLENAGSSLNDVVKVTVFLRNEEDFASMNKVYQSYFRENKPARTTVIAGLALPNMLIEMDCVAYFESSE